MHSDKESKFDKLSVLLLDVAGTTTSLEYIKEKLFSFILEESTTFVTENFEKEEVKNALKELQEGDKELNVDSGVEIIKKLTNENSNDKNFKSLQGLISKAGYEKGTLKGHIFEDVKIALETWSKDKTVAIFSSGDIESQKLLFGNTVEGNLLSHISKFFDLSIGVKTASESYSKIAEELKVKCDEIVFVSDAADELTAAKEAGLVTALIKRKGNEDVSEEIAKKFTFTITSLADIPAEFSNKRKVEESLDGSETPPSKLAKTDEQTTGEEVLVPKSDEKSVTENVSEDQKKNTDKETEAMEVDSTSVEIKNTDEQNVPTNAEISMDTDEVVADKTATIVSEKTELENTKEKSKPPTEKNSHSDETEVKTEIIDGTNEIVSLDKIPDKVVDANSTDEKEKSTGREGENALENNAPTSKTVQDTVEPQTKVEVNEMDVNNDTGKSVNEVDKVPDSNNGDKAKIINKVCNETEETKTLEPSETVDKKEIDKASCSNEECTDKKLEESKEESDVKSDEKTEEITEEKKHPIKESNGTKEESCEIKEKISEIKEKISEIKEKISEPKEKKNEEKIETSDTAKEEVKCPSSCNEEEVKNDSKIVAEKSCVDTETTEENNSTQSTIVKESTLNAQENGSTSENQNGNISSEVSNGVVNGQDSCDASSNGQNEEATDIKVKKAETNVDSPTVAVEV
ncbi:hypothetical protein RI129_003416 [Pyrocoelia pectoralis]|uniref:Enolase-phosphatase E1 n=1 Tax=Pyrocoelia pectoralis TaxID=417401 RepID=A0AAN7VR52_9COLE